MKPANKLLLKRCSHVIPRPRSHCLSQVECALQNWPVVCTIVILLLVLQITLIQFTLSTSSRVRLIYEGNRKTSRGTPLVSAAVASVFMRVLGQGTELRLVEREDSIDTQHETAGEAGWSQRST